MAEFFAFNGVAASVRKLECEIDELASDNAQEKEEIKKLNMEIECLVSHEAEMREEIKEMENEVARCSDEGKAAITARTAELETEVVRLQRLSISEMDEARMGVAELRDVLEERETRVEFLEREVKGMKQVNAEGEMKVRDLERKLGVLEVKEIEERSKRIRIEEGLKDKVGDKKREIEGFREKIEELENKKSEMEKWMKEKMKLEEALRESEEKARSMESVIHRLREEAEKVTRTMKEKVVAAFIRAVYGIHGEVKGVELQWPIVAAGSAAAIAVVISVFWKTKVTDLRKEGNVNDKMKTRG